MEKHAQKSIIMEIKYYNAILPEDTGTHDYVLNIRHKKAVVKAHELSEILSTEIVASLIGNGSYRKEIYLYGKDDRLYFHMCNDVILNKYIPYQAALSYLDSCDDYTRIGTAKERRPNGWYFNECYPAGEYIVVRETHQKEYNDALIRYKKTYKPSFLLYYVNEEFPLIIHNALELKILR